jgi:hypothetical protein
VRCDKHILPCGDEGECQRLHMLGVTAEDQHDLRYVTKLMNLKLKLPVVSAASCTVVCSAFIHTRENPSALVNTHGQISKCHLNFRRF